MKSGSAAEICIVCVYPPRNVSTTVISVAPRVIVQAAISSSGLRILSNRPRIFVMTAAVITYSTASYTVTFSAS